VESVRSLSSIRLHGVGVLSCLELASDESTCLGYMKEGSDASHRSPFRLQARKVLRVVL